MDLAKTIINWYGNNQRPLPWRDTSDPYKLWVSEVILQQTRVEQGLDYYLRFVEEFPDIKSLSEASEESVLNIWQGLGYYSRARNMHFTAKMVMESYHGKFPRKYSEILKLKGVGDYTAAAIASFAFKLPHPAIDGNVMRFIARLKGITEAVNTAPGKKLIKEFLENEIDRKEPGQFNQAVMEFGALVCKPRNPGCTECPFQSVCVARNTGTVDKFPVKETKRSLKARYFHYLVQVLEQDNQVFTFIYKRLGNDIWKNMYEFPMIEANRLFDWNELVEGGHLKKLWPDDLPVLVRSSVTFQHILSHRKLIARYFVIKSSKGAEGSLKVKLKEVNDFPLPKLMERILDHANITFSLEND